MTRGLFTSALYAATLGVAMSAYLVYLRRSRIDAFEGVFGGDVRHIVEGRIRSDAPALLDALRRKLEAGDPPNAAPSSEGPS